jgi:hypothetical protein
VDRSNGPMNLEIGWRGNVLMIILGFKLGLSEDNLMLGGLLNELILIWTSLWLIIWTRVVLILKMCPWYMENVLDSSRIFSL